METQTKSFDSVTESRKWREATSRKLDAMTRDERMAYLRSVGDRVRAELRARHPAVTAS